MAKKIPYLALLVFIILGLYLRIYGTLNGYFAFTYDQGRDLLVLKDIVTSGNIRLIGPTSGIEGVFHGVWWYWLLVPFYIIFQGDPKFIITAFGILSSLVIVVAFYLGKMMKDWKLGIIFAGLSATSQHFISVAAQLWNPNMLPLLIMMYLICLWIFLKRTGHFYWCAFFLGAIFEFHIGFGGMLILATILAIIFTKTFLSIKESFLSFVAFCLWLLPRLIFDLRHDFLQTKSIIKYLQHPQAVQNQLPLFSRLIDRLKTFWDAFIYAYANNQTIIYILLVLLCFIFMIKVFQNKQDKVFLRFNLILLLGILFLATLYQNALWDYYLIGIPAMLLPFVSLVLYQIVKWRPPIGWLIFLILLIVNISPGNFFKPAWAGDASVYFNQIKVIDEIYRHAQNQPFNVSVYSPSSIDYNYEYLFSWYGQKKYGYIPDRQNNLSQVFFIIEPDPWNKGLREIWIKDRVGDGKTLWYQDFTGEILVEQRIRK